MSETIEAQQITVTTSAEGAMQAFVGKNYAYYQRKWAFVKTPGALKGFNVAAFFLGVIWLVYRKMYLYAAIFVGILLLDGIVEYYFPLPEAIGKGLTWAIAAVFGLLGNSWYKAHADKKVNEITATYPPEQVGAELAKQGGVNLAGAWAFGLAVIGLVGVVVWAILSDV